ncbi:hypothetical protein TSAR_016759 [Trichomalopsis sarcophagae]|uniref:Uncharacterized protein n=1 Tax=Trichomalopsis sarcophagae TaxID=543379 RepID=A0A232FMW0_9HYME|nr:hypothetical protein TSAR_016759 [Trichomalopsis sarcophagae]
MLVARQSRLTKSNDEWVTRIQSEIWLVAWRPRKGLQRVPRKALKICQQLGKRQASHTSKQTTERLTENKRKPSKCFLPPTVEPYKSLDRHNPGLSSPVLTVSQPIETQDET